MGLDMYLESSSIGEVAYWRKANAIHAWFERRLCRGGEIKNCKFYKVSKPAIKALLADCVAVQDILDRCKTYYDGHRNKIYVKPVGIMDILPPKLGFFFGTDDIDEYYYESIVYTKEVCYKLLLQDDFKSSTLEYHAWW